MDMVIPVIVCLLLGALIALILTAGYRSELHSVRTATNAKHYIKDGSFNLTDNRDIFMYKKVEKTARPKQDTNQQNGNS